MSKYGTVVYELPAKERELWAQTIAPLHDRWVQDREKEGHQNARVLIAVCLAYALVPSIVWLAAVRLAHGLGWGIVTTAGGTVVADLLPPARRGGSTYYSAFDSGVGLGAVILGWVAEAYDFPTMYVAAAALTAVGLAVFAVMRPDRTERQWQSSALI
ncbi:MAG: MFS transporter [Chloroflexi bacterium]|nr:MFS transporter [Chloroflexota bacterium]